MVGAPCRIRKGASYSEGWRICQPTSMPGKKAPPAQLSSAARSSPSGVMEGAGRPGGKVPVGRVKWPSAQRLISAYWVGVTVSRMCWWWTPAASGYGSSPRSFGMYGQVSVARASGGRSQPRIAARAAAWAGDGSVSSAQSSRV